MYKKIPTIGSQYSILVNDKLITIATAAEISSSCLINHTGFLDRDNRYYVYNWLDRKLSFNSGIYGYGANEKVIVREPTQRDIIEIALR